MLLASRGKFAHVCIEVDFDKPLMAGYRMGREYYRLQYEVLHDLCFDYGRYGHRSVLCPERTERQSDKGKQKVTEVRTADTSTSTGEEEAGYGEWTTVQRNQRRGPSMARGKSGIDAEFQKNGDTDGDNATSKPNLQRTTAANSPTRSNGANISSLTRIRGNNEYLKSRSGKGALDSIQFMD